MMRQTSIKTKFGWVSAFEQEGKIVRIKFGKHKNKSKSKNLRKFRSYLNNFFLKGNKSIKFKFFQKGNPVQIKVWKEIKKIKFGRTITYGKIAKKYNLSPRHVGKICGQNKIVLVVPCHRVVRSDGNLGGFSSRGGINLKKKLLDFERN